MLDFDVPAPKWCTEKVQVYIESIYNHFRKNETKPFVATEQDFSKCTRPGFRPENGNFSNARISNRQDITVLQLIAN